MRVAVTTKGKSIAEQSDRRIYFTIYEVANGKTRGRIIAHASDSGNGDAMAFILKNEGVKVLLCGAIKEKIKNGLKNCGIEVVDGQKGNVDSLIKAYLLGKLGKPV